VRIRLASVFVDDQEKALTFYTEVLGFIKKQDFPVGDFRWLTVVSPEEPEGTELLLEPNDNPAAKTFQEALFAQGIAALSFAAADIHQEAQRLKEQGVVFQMEPTDVGSTSLAVFDDTCGNLIQIFQI
jgi:predicted enzyme related to lactoylglutathione lyase